MLFNLAGGLAGSVAGRGTAVLSAMLRWYAAGEHVSAMLNVTIYSFSSSCVALACPHAAVR